MKVAKDRSSVVVMPEDANWDELTPDGREKIIFLHMSKCAGRAFQNLFCENYPNYWEWNNYDEIEKTKLEVFLAFDLIIGHIPYWGIKHLLQYGYKVVAIFRRPIDRTISEYNHLMTMPNKIEKSDMMRERNFSFYEFVTSEELKLNLWVNNYTSYLGYHGVEEYSAPDYYTHALNVLRNKIDFIGIYEHFDQTVDRLKKRFNLKGKIKPVGVTAKKNKAKIPREEILQAMPYLGTDIVLYETAKWIFENEVK